MYGYGMMMMMMITTIIIVIIIIVVVSLRVLIQRIAIQYEDREECMFDSSFSAYPTGFMTN